MCTVCEQQSGLVTAAVCLFLFFFSGYLIVLCHSSVVWWVGWVEWKNGNLLCISVRALLSCPDSKMFRSNGMSIHKMPATNLLHPFCRAILQALSTSAKVGLSGRLWDAEAAKNFLLETVLCLSFVLRRKYFCSLIFFFHFYFFPSSRERPIHNKLETYLNFDRWKWCHNACAVILKSKVQVCQGFPLAGIVDFWLLLSITNCQMTHSHHYETNV